MRWIISPAKQMKIDRDFLPPRDLPAFLPETEELLGVLRQMDLPEMKALLRCSDKLAEEAWHRFRTMDLRRGLTPALLAYQGIQYRYMAPGVMEEPAYDHLQEHLRILSGFYGILRPLDGVACYRLEMQAKLSTARGKTLYDFWGSRLAETLAAETDTVLNLASEEYARAVRHHLPGGVQWIDVTFGELEGEKVVEKGVYVKMARGEMVRHLAALRRDDPDAVASFTGLGYRLDETRSTGTHFVFLRQKDPS